MEPLNITKIFRALSNEQRLKLFKMIYDCQAEQCSNNNSDCAEGVDKAFTKACNHLSVARSTISYHMKELENAGLISIIRNGQSFKCEINMDAVKAIQQFLG
ncbi:MAG TPA: helix-turn-helix domain-containing protein [Anaerolineae bacterium]|nr:helix-turn-helix domain-containing protein [Anaerolineae bacterium]